MKNKKHYKVVCAIIKNNDCYFVCQRGSGGECAHKWEFPGGKIEENETNEMALIREIKEELNLDIKIIKYLLTVEHSYQTFNITLITYLCELINDTLVLKEHLDYKWLSKEQLIEIDFAQADIKIIDFLRGNDL